MHQVRTLITQGIAQVSSVTIHGHSALISSASRAAASTSRGRLAGITPAALIALWSISVPSLRPKGQRGLTGPPSSARGAIERPGRR